MKIKYRFVSLRFEIVNEFRIIKMNKYYFKNGKGNETNQAFIQLLFFVISILWINK